LATGTGTGIGKKMVKFIIFLNLLFDFYAGTAVQGIKVPCKNNPV